MHFYSQLAAAARSASAQNRSKPKFGPLCAVLVTEKKYAGIAAGMPIAVGAGAVFAMVSDCAASAAGKENWKFWKSTKEIISDVPAAAHPEFVPCAPAVVGWIDMDHSAVTA